MSRHLILFDCDGTLVDSQAQIVRAMQQAIAACGQAEPTAAAVRGVIGLSLADAVARLLPQASAALRKQAADRYRRAYALQASAPLFPGVLQTLACLRARGYLLGIVTGKSRRGLLRQMDATGLHAFIQVWRTADCCPSKPHPAMVLECMRETGVAAAHTAVVGDTCHDMHMAAASNVRALGVGFGVESPAVLLAHGAAAVVAHFAELAAYFPPLPGSAPAATMADTKVV